MKQTPYDPFGPSTLSVYHQGIAEATKHPSLKQQLKCQQGELLPRFVAHYGKLKTLPRRLRRSLQRQWKRSLAGIALLLALGQMPAVAATIHVQQGCSLVDAITAANEDANVGACRSGRGADTIVLPKGSTQTLTTVNNSNVGENGLPAITSTITIEGNGSTIERAAGAPGFRIFFVDLGASLTLHETTVSGGELTNPESPYDEGGGAIWNSGKLTLTDSTVSGNTAEFGGGIFNFHSAMRVTNSTLSDNKAATYSGGAVYNFFSAAHVTKSTITGNSAEYGGGFHTRTETTITGDLQEVDECANPTGPIPCIHAYDAGPVTLAKTTISDNTAGQEGGGLMDFAGTASVIKSTISGNSAGTSGGGVYAGGNYASETIGLVELENSTISGNSAEQGGGLYVSNLQGAAEVLNSTITRNSANKGGGVYVQREGASITLSRALIAGNEASVAAEVFVGADSLATVADFNLFGHSGDAGVKGFTPGPTDIVPNQSLDQILNTDLANNDGLTLTHALPARSPAIDAVTDGSCPPPNTDQRDVKRPQDGNNDGAAICDIGSLSGEPVNEAEPVGQRRQTEVITASLLGAAPRMMTMAIGEQDAPFASVINNGA